MSEAMKHYIADESIGGVEREYIEVERKADVGDYVNLTVYAGDTIDEVLKINEVCPDGSLWADDFNIEELDCDVYKTLEPTNIVRIDGARYRLVERKAEVGEKVLDVLDNCKIHTIVPAPYKTESEWYAFETENGSDIAPIGKGEYLVLEPAHPCDNCGTALGDIACSNGEGGTYCSNKCAGNDDLPAVDATQASPQVIDMLANLARRVTSLEAQLSDTQRNVETFAQQTESNTKDIALLDERTTVGGVSFTAEQLSAIIEAIGGVSR